MTTCLLRSDKPKHDITIKKIRTVAKQTKTNITEPSEEGRITKIIVK